MHSRPLVDVYQIQERMNAGMGRPGLGCITPQLSNAGQMNFPAWAHLFICKVKTTIPACHPPRAIVRNRKVASSHLSYKISVSFIPHLILHRENKDRRSRCLPVSAESVSSCLPSSESLPCRLLRRPAPPASLAPRSWSLPPCPQHPIQCAGWAAC